MRLRGSSTNGDDELNQTLERARQVLEKSKAKLASKDSPESEAPEAAPLPFFASLAGLKRDGVIKSRDEKTGLITADGEKLAKLSEAEVWENRSLLEVFDNDLDEDAAVYARATTGLADRDVAASIYGLRKQLMNEDYRQIFDKRNRFIGEDN